MADAELNHADKWDAPPALGAVLQAGGITARLLEEPEQWLVSGDLAAFAVACPARTLRLARDRVLAIGALGDVQPGWNTAGFAVTAAGAALAVIALSGDGLPGLMATATPLDLANPGPSAATSFAGVPVILDLAAQPLCLHVERGLVAYLWSWLGAFEPAV